CLERREKGEGRVGVRLVVWVSAPAVKLCALLTLDGRLAAIPNQHPHLKTGQFPNLSFPAETLPDTRHVILGGLDGAVIPERPVYHTSRRRSKGQRAEATFGMALSPDGKTLAHHRGFSNWPSCCPVAQQVPNQPHGITGEPGRSPAGFSPGPARQNSPSSPR